MPDDEKNPQQQGEPRPSLTITFDPATNSFASSFSGNMPIPLLVNQLEVLKAMLINQQLQVMQEAMTRAAAMKPKIVGPGGFPLR